MKVRFLATAAALLFAAAPAPAEGLLPELTLEQQVEARKILEGFESNPRGPFYRIRWFCNDGTDHPPSPYPCADRGGGRQHASLSEEAKKLAEWEIDVGTIFAAMSFEEFFDAALDHHRMKQLALEQYLEQIDAGWIYRRANSYRGARQVEDEEKAGRRLLTRLLSDPDWVRRRYFLAQEVAAATPHGLPTSAVKRARNLAESIADADERFQSIRAKIHSNPGDRDLQLVEEFAAERQVSDSVKKLLVELAAALREERAGRRLAERLQVIRKQPHDEEMQAAIESFARALEQGDTEAAWSAGARVTYRLTRRVFESSDGAANLERLDFNAIVQEYGFQSAPQIAGRSRREGLQILQDHFRYAFGAGLISGRQLEALQQEAAKLEGGDKLPAARYFEASRYLARSAEWARAAAAREFGPLTRFYTPLDPQAAGFLDQALRSSAAFPLARNLETWMADANQALGLRHDVLGADAGSGVFGLNPGRARGKLAILRSLDEPIDPAKIYVIPETVSDLKPMAGVLTLDSGNALSHTQLLAANLGIPNATVPSRLRPELEAFEGDEVVYEVSPRGEVLLELAPESEDEPAPEAAAERLTLDVSRMRLDRRDLPTLVELSDDGVGVVCGPKAGNLGRLARLFPEYVAPGFVIPFGIYHAHISRSLGEDVEPFTQRVYEAFTEAERLRESGASVAEVRAYINPRLADFRRLIENMPLLSDFERKLRDQLSEQIGPDGSYGVFVRSDTNAEDLPEFTGAGLNRTIPNVVGVDKIIDAVKQVWASPFSERAHEWRSRVLDRQDRVYPSVLVQRTVEADKSGVIATMDLATGDRDAITVNVNEGVSAVVDGGVAESLLLQPDGGVKLLQQARATYRKTAATDGGFKLEPPLARERVLEPEEIEAVRDLVAAVEQRFPPVDGADGRPMPWDIEFGFENGELRLFQIRPLVRRQAPEPLQAEGTVDLGGEL